MAKTHHIHVHLHDYGLPTNDAFEESKHKREGGKFSSTGGAGGAAAPQQATGVSAFAAKHKHNPAAARKGVGPQGEKEVAEEKASLL